MVSEVRVGENLQADEGVLLGYLSGRDHPRGLVLGRDARLRSGTVIYAGSCIGDRFASGHHVIVREQSVIGDDVAIWSNSVIDYGCSIGNRVKIHSNCYVAQFSILEDDVFLAPGTIFSNDLYPGNPDSANLMAGPRIEAGAQVGVSVTVLPYVTVGKGAIIGAGSVVTRDIPAHTVAYGCPAVAVKDVEQLAGIRQRVETLASARGRNQLRG
jgi:acetyltransferase-like isoleucine patch superfamily enzyme